jgi:hypothetical protein
MHPRLIQPPAALDWGALLFAATKVAELGGSVIGDEAEAAALLRASVIFHHQVLLRQEAAEDDGAH